MKEVRKSSIASSQEAEIPSTLESVFVSFSCNQDTAYAAYEVPTGIRWDELPRAEGEFLVRLGASTQRPFDDPSRAGFRPHQGAAIGGARGGGMPMS